MVYAWLNSFDQPLSLAINSFVNRFPVLDRAAEFACQTDLPCVAVVAAIWWSWFVKLDPAKLRQLRIHLICTLLGSLAAVVVARALVIALPFRLRPRFEPALHFVIPRETTPAYFVDWSSFPSDHMVVVAALAAGAGFLSRRFMLTLLAFSVVFIGLARIYLGLHYTSDVVVGIVIGLVIGLAANHRIVRDAIGNRVMRWHDTIPSTFYAAFFLLTFEIATMFSGMRSIVSAAAKVLTAYTG